MQRITSRQQVCVPLHSNGIKSKTNPEVDNKKQKIHTKIVKTVKNGEGNIGKINLESPPLLRLMRNDQHSPLAKDIIDEQLIE